MLAGLIGLGILNLKKSGGGGYKYDQAMVFSSILLLFGNHLICFFMVIALQNQLMEKGSVFISTMKGFTPTVKMEISSRHNAKCCSAFVSTRKGLSPTGNLDKSKYIAMGKDLGEERQKSVQNGLEEKQIGGQGKQLIQHWGKVGTVKIKTPRELGAAGGGRSARLISTICRWSKYKYNKWTLEDAFLRSRHFQH